MTDRPEGYYWITDGGSAPEVAVWSGGHWWLTGCDEAGFDRQITVLGGPITPPPHGDVPATSRSPCSP